MKPIIVLAAMAIAVTGLGVGFLGNDITLNVQSLGVGETTLTSDIDDAFINFNISKVYGNQNNIKNVIADCIISSGQEIPALSRVFCKLTDENGNVVAEGITVIQTHLNAGSTLAVPISDPNFVNSQVQNIHDVILVVQGPSAGSP